MYDIVLFFASTIQFVGGLLMVSAYLRRIPKKDAIAALISAFVRGNAAKMYARTAANDPTSRAAVVQGIAFVVFGFLVQSIASIAKFTWP